MTLIQPLISSFIEPIVPRSSAPNEAPVAAFSHVVTLRNVQFTDESTDADGSIVAWDWDFGDGTTHGTTQNPSHDYATDGAKTVRLTVTDNKGATHYVEHTVTPVRGTITPLALTSGADTTDGGPFAVASHTPTAGALMLMGLAITGTTPANPAIADSRGWTWTLVPGGTILSSTTNRCSLYYLVAPSATAGTITLTPGGGDGNTGLSWGLVEYAGAASDGTVSPGIEQVQALSAGASTGLAITLNPFEHANNYHVYFAMHNANEATTAGDSFTSRADVTRATPGIGFKVADKINDRTAGPTWATSSPSRWVAVEVKCA